MTPDSTHDAEQNRRLRDVEARINSLEAQVAQLLGRLETMTGLMKLVAVAVGTMVGIDIQGMVV